MSFVEHQDLPNVGHRKGLGVKKLQRAAPGAIVLHFVVDDRIVADVEDPVNSDVIFRGTKMNDTTLFWCGPICWNPIANIFNGGRESCLNSFSQKTKPPLSFGVEPRNVLGNEGTLLVGHDFIIHLPICRLPSIDNRGRNLYNGG